MALSACLRPALIIFAALVGLASADACNPLNGPCPAIPGLPSSTYSIDFSQQTTTPSDWILADFAKVNYGAPNGANFTFAKRYDAPYIWSRFYVLFGRIEVVLKAAPGAGVITGAVMMSDDLDEIDWEWSGNNFLGATGKVQTNFFGKGVTGYYDRGSTPAVNAPQDQFHTYALDWSPDALIWSIDGQNVRTLKNSHAASGEYQYPQTPSRLHLGVWCAGDPDNNGATVAWGGGYTNFSLAPFSAYVKSVKITTPTPCSSWQYPNPFDGTYKSVLCTNQTIANSLPCTYAVVPGDDGYKISKTLGVTLDALKASNPEVNWDVLLIGQSLSVPGGDCTTSSSTSSMLSTTSSIQTSSNATSTVTVVSSLTSSITLTSTTPTAVPSNVPASANSTSSNSSMASTTTMTTAAKADSSSSSSISSAVKTNSSSSTATTTSAVKSNVSSSTSTLSSSSLKGTTAQQPLPSSYTVVAGDYGYSIATKLHCNFEDLKAANPGLDWDKLMNGQTLSVPATDTGSPISSTQFSSSNTVPGSNQTTARPADVPTDITSSPSLTASSASTAATDAATSVSPVSSRSVPAASSGPKTASSCAGSNHQPPANPTATITTISSGNSGSSSTAPSSQVVTTSPAKSTSTVAAISTAPPIGTVSSSPSSPSSIVPSFAQGTGASVSPSSSSISSPAKVSPAIPASGSKLICNQDNCLRNMIDPRYSSSMFAFCQVYTTKAASTVALPTFLGGCPKDDKRVSSACSCLVSSFAPPTRTPAMTSPALRAGTPSWRLKRSPLRWDRARG